MSKMIVAVFENEQNARNGLGELQSLHTEGFISLISNAILVKGEDGKVEVEELSDHGGEGTAAGLLLGGVLGLLAGPFGAIAGASAGVVATMSLGGAALGASVGSMAGLVADLDELNVDLHFAEQVAEVLEAGKTAVLAEFITDPDQRFEERLEAFGGVIHLQSREEIAEELYEINAAAYQAELDELQREWHQSNADAKDRIEEKMAVVRDKILRLNEDADSRLKANRKRFDVRIAVLRDQMKRASEELKLRLEARIEAVREDFSTRNEKLKQARTLTSEALAPKPVKAA